MEPADSGGPTRGKARRDSWYPNEKFDPAVSDQAVKAMGADTEVFTTRRLTGSP
jgi:hypothetical protein